MPLFGSSETCGILTLTNVFLFRSNSSVSIERYLSLSLITVLKLQRNSQHSSSDINHFVCETFSLNTFMVILCCLVFGYTYLLPIGYSWK